MDPFDTATGWQRLDPRMLLVHPVRDIVRFLPALVGILVFGRSADGEWWALVGVGIPVTLGLLRYLTTSYRISTARIEVRHGFVNKRVLSAPLDRVRTVDVTASVIHRVLGLVTLQVGTGQSDAKSEDRLALDGLAAPAAAALRERLLHLSPETESESAPATQVREVLRLDPSWVRFAPLTSTGIAIAGAALGVLFQSFHSLELMPSIDLDRVARLGVALLLVLAFVGVLLTICVLAVIGYLLTNFGFLLTHTGAEGSWHMRRGLLTTRETTLDDARVSGVSIGEPLSLRLAHGARLAAIVTGLDKRQQGGGSVLVPPAPRDVVDRVAVDVLGVAGPVTASLVTHGPRAHRRRWTRAMLPAGIVAAASAVAAYAESWWFLGLALVALAAGAGLAHDRWRSLGHALVDGHLVARSGSLDRRREALHTPSVIGWNLRATWFQRRARLTDLVATTAGGRQYVAVIDLDETSATTVASSATPGLLDQFLA